MVEVHGVPKMNLRDKRHVFVFNTDMGEMTVATDDLREIEARPWFQRFFGSVSKRDVPEEPDYEVRARQLAQQMYEEAMQRQAQAAQQAQQQQSQVPPQQARQATSQSQQPQGAARVPVPPQQQQVRQSYLEIPPDKLSNEMWEQMNEAEQRAYYQKYAGNQK